MPKTTEKQGADLVKYGLKYEEKYGIFEGYARLFGEFLKLLKLAELTIPLLQGGENRVILTGYVEKMKEELQLEPGWMEEE